MIAPMPIPSSIGDHDDILRVIEEANAQANSKFTYIIGEHLRYKPPAAACPYYNLVPKETMLNLEFREKILDLAKSDRQAQRDLWLMCSRDILFWINTFAWTYDPRAVKLRQAPQLPFITWPVQDHFLLTLQRDIGECDVNIQKSRDVGASWCVLTSYDHRILFRDEQAFLMVSRTEDLVDEIDNPDSLFWKLDYINDNLPGWMLPDLERKRLSLTNLERKGVISGASTTGDVGRGGRRTSALLDEFASFPVKVDYEAYAACQRTSDSLVFLSTPKGEGKCHSTLRHNKNITQVSIHWSSIPGRSKGLRISPGNERFGDYVTVKGEPTSDWFEREARRSSVPFLVRQELQIDYVAASHPFFDPAILDRVRLALCQHPAWTGFLDIDGAALMVDDLTERAGGPLRLWFRPDQTMRPPRADPIVIGVDISQGAGDGSNSVAAVWNKRTRERIAEFVSPHVQPEEFAEIVISLCRWFANDEIGISPTLIWEGNGPGMSFGRRVMKSGYQPIWFRRNEDDLVRRPTTKPGWFSTPKTKVSLLTEYRKALGTEHAINRCFEAIDEAAQYVYEGGTIEHSASLNAMAPTESGENHGDRVIADAVAWRAIEDNPIKRDAPPAQRAKHGMAARLAERAKERRRTRHNFY
mgnify:FL=1